VPGQRVQDAERLLDPRVDRLAGGEWSGGAGHVVDDLAQVVLLQSSLGGGVQSSGARFEIVAVDRLDAGIAHPLAQRETGCAFGIEVDLGEAGSGRLGHPERVVRGHRVGGVGPRG
jgi:hypothetical protein